MEKPNSNSAGGQITVEGLMRKFDGVEVEPRSISTGKRTEIAHEDLEDLLEAAARDAAARPIRTYPIVCPVVIESYGDTDLTMLELSTGQYPATSRLLESIANKHVAANRELPIFFLAPDSNGAWHGACYNEFDTTPVTHSMPAGTLPGDGHLTRMLKTAKAGLCIVAVSSGHWDLFLSATKREGLALVLVDNHPERLTIRNRRAQPTRNWVD